MTTSVFKDKAARDIREQIQRSGDKALVTMAEQLGNQQLIRLKQLVREATS